jgi:hypothetical protein
MTVLKIAQHKGGGVGLVACLENDAECLAVNAKRTAKSEVFSFEGVVVGADDAEGDGLRLARQRRVVDLRGGV